MIMTPSVIAAVAGLKNGHKINSVDEKLYRVNMQHALNEIREKNNGKDSGPCSSRQKGKSKSSKKGPLKKLPE